ncbi:hypothetical protein [uncultured Chryseobacterium sp.]|uniref:hypothetical protein n=1 Tax=uncultured Chryseobacterium sp. TaxID=259322 RepID=UPI002587FAED|nr:hypothetical protein [uncultured Chryseobacterium sp.]
MQLKPKQYDFTLQSFLSSWNLERIKAMTIDEYADLSNHDSLCYWLEYGTKNLGEIGGMQINKFELWKPQAGENKQFRDGRFTMEGKYAYKSKRGATLNQAFETIRNLIIDIVHNSLEENWEAIVDNEFHAIVKWKLACLFSKKQLLSIYSRRALLSIARGLGYSFTNGDNILVIQQAIISKKTNDEDIVDFAYRVYSEFAERDKTNKRNYFIIGSKYSDDEGYDTVSVIDKFIDNRCIAIGWLDWLDFSSYMGKKYKEVNDFVENNWNSGSPAISKIKSYFRHLSDMKAGDIIAVKSQGAYGKLTIIAYAQVVEREGEIYWHDDSLLGHHINVEFLEVGFSHETGETYAGTVHKLTADKDGERFSKVFGWHAADWQEDSEEEEYGEIVVFDEPDDEGYRVKVETSFQRSAIASVTVNRIHNRIQNRFVEYLNTQYPNDACSGEKRYIDAKRITADKIYIYEIKPFTSVYSCIREGLGQLFDYMHREHTSKEKRLVIVGPNEPNSTDKKFLADIKDNLKVPFSYIAFNESEMTAKEY